MALRFYTAYIEGDETSGFSVFFPDLPGCVTTGETVQEAAAMAAEALAGHVEVMVEYGDEVPEPSAPDAPLPEWLEAADADERATRIVARVLVPVEMPGRSVRANITIDEALLARLDAAAATTGMSRSGFIAEAVRRMIGRPIAPARSPASAIADR